MIRHEINYYVDAFSYTWLLELPYRLNVGDRFDTEVIGDLKILHGDNPLTEEWYNFTRSFADFEVEFIQISTNGTIDAWIKILSE